MIFDFIARRAELAPDRPAVFFERRWYSYGELNNRAERLAVCLAESGIGKGDRVGILAFNHLAHLDLIFAAPKLGFIYTPFNYRLSAHEQQQLADDVKPKLMLHDLQHQKMAASTRVPLLNLKDYENRLAAATHTVLRHPALDVEDTHMILFTGGSTGLPKGAMLPYRQTHFNVMSTVESWGLRDSDCVVQATPSFHAAVNALTLPLLAIGGRVVLPWAFEAEHYLNLVLKHKATLMFMVPTMYQMLADRPNFLAADLSAIRWAISGGAPCPLPIRHLFADKGVLFKQGYGLTEAGVNCFTFDIEAAQRHPGSVGQPMPNTEAVIRDPNGAPVTRGECGELTLRGPHVFKGYWKRPEETAKTLRDGWLWTGDLAREDDDGYFYITGRSKEMFISGGENVFPLEVESALYEIPAVAECAVLGVPHSLWGETGLAAIVLRPGNKTDAELVRAALLQQLASYKVPTHFLFLEALPKSGAGKILKPEIRRLFENGQPIQNTKDDGASGEKNNARKNQRGTVG